MRKSDLGIPKTSLKEIIDKTVEELLVKKYTLEDLDNLILVTPELSDAYFEHLNFTFKMLEYFRDRQMRLMLGSFTADDISEVEREREFEQLREPYLGYVLLTEQLYPHIKHIDGFEDVDYVEQFEQAKKIRENCSDLETRIKLEFLRRVKS